MPEKIRPRSPLGLAFDVAQKSPPGHSPRGKRMRAGAQKGVVKRSIPGDVAGWVALRVSPV